MTTDEKRSQIRNAATRSVEIIQVDLLCDILDELRRIASPLPPPCPQCQGVTHHLPRCSNYQGLEWCKGERNGQCNHRWGTHMAEDGRFSDTICFICGDRK